MFGPLLILAAAVAAMAQPPRRLPPAPASRLDLTRNWQVESSAGGRRYPARVPSTIVSTLVDNGALPDPYFGMNLRAFAGVNYWIGDNFSNRPMPDGSPYGVPWWYRTTFQLPADLAGERLWLHFDSINYRANVWLNRRQIADSNQLRGMYRTFEFDVTEAAVRGANLLEVEFFAPTEDDFTITWVDWNPMPPDKDMGITGPAYLTRSGPVAVRNPQVVGTSRGSLGHERRVRPHAESRTLRERRRPGMLGD